MCRHNAPKTLCGVDPQFYQDSLSNDRRLRLFLCEDTRNDALAALTGQKHLERILLAKSTTQIKYLENKLRKNPAMGAQITADCNGDDEA
ncbi:hypothetical protein FDECE_6738 [Fusarium decemcellulare]|nr:hypothetical protein FDECE_6738 [Fusarium decemcellulare]